MPADIFLSNRNPEITLRQKIWQLNWGLVILLCLIAGVGFAMLYSAANGSMSPWASRQLMRFGIGLFIMFVVALIDVRFWFRHAYLIYLGSLALLVAVEVMGTIGMGAQRWIDLGFIRLQPSEVMKVSLILALARYFHGVSMEDIGRPTYLMLPLALVMAPAALVLKQPDLGTSGMLLLAASAVFLCAGVRWWKFALVFVAGLAAVPIGWQFLHDYQKARVMTFLNPENDPLGAGYHAMQAMIAFGSGGVTGKGFMQGTQSHLNFLPEKQTDFIFTMLAEEFGLMGSLGLLALYFLLLVYGFAIAFRARNQFARLLAIGLTTNLFLYVFINMAMVMGVFPVVGVPLPLVSYGGTALLTLMTAMGLVISCYIHRDIRISRRGTAEV
ncbi:rod shape-determining protein RodA [Pelagibius litoralis]|uniref:Peptidoglycan glycosyltransferase MrdB n=1 Tax=Pelagibius litoralis TaxID=374515 RepID=A0A967C4K3_9PROT|nr:rod shape-determining protein RodA [Pelagibius litoralis]NIA68544.1 rod shape-determining protein RodA [Pelagibius litoralis]